MGTRPPGCPPGGGSRLPSPHQQPSSLRPVPDGGHGSLGPWGAAGVRAPGVWGRALHLFNRVQEPGRSAGAGAEVRGCGQVSLLRRAWSGRRTPEPGTDGTSESGRARGRQRKEVYLNREHTGCRWASFLPKSSSLGRRKGSFRDLWRCHLHLGPTRGDRPASRGRFTCSNAIASNLGRGQLVKVG